MDRDVKVTKADRDTDSLSTRSTHALRRACGRFRQGDRVHHLEHGWAGAVDGAPSDKFIVWCTFDGVGQYGANPLKLEKLA